jgi:hypothetical protein
MQFIAFNGQVCNSEAICCRWVLLGVSRRVDGLCWASILADVAVVTSFFFLFLERCSPFF